MEDALRPTDEAFKAFYEKGYETWFRLWRKASQGHDLPETCLRFEDVFPQHPHLPAGIQLGEYGMVNARTTWFASQGCCDLPSFELRFQSLAGVHKPLAIDLEQKPSSPFPRWLEDHDHLTVLVLAWAYVLSARWAEIISQASGPEYLESLAPWEETTVRDDQNNNAPSIVIDIGNANHNAARWWSAVLAPGRGWKVSATHKNSRLASPWSLTLDPRIRFVLAGEASTTDFMPSLPATFTDAIGYIEDYVALHNASRQNQVAFATALLLPLANLDDRKVVLPVPQTSHTKSSEGPLSQTPIWGNDLRQFDRLLTLSCNAHGMRAILGSVFYEPNIPSHVCGAWLQGTLALLQSDFARDPDVLARMFFLRSPHLACLWLGGIVSGAHAPFVRNADALLGFNRIDLHAAAWTETLHSFIQEPVSRLPADATSISRADECRLMYLSDETHRDIPPIFPYPPLGDIPLHDTDLGVRAHAHCPGTHGLMYSSIAWPCENGRKEIQAAPRLLLAGCEPDADAAPDEAPIAINYDRLDREMDESEPVTRNIFCWMRDADGFPVSERDIYRHEWIWGWDSDDDCSSLHPEGNGMSTAGWNIPVRAGRWQSRVATKRCNSL
ncbi:putative immunoglobulin variable region used by the ITC63b heavy chain [Rosellinia necatrix]|uniref:Putative immunoglobulin variable region used by the ITC63b heavy chain n=1 Tax=Rosellinia necatrix TaxID=77044 RepID=A0A1W2TT39_ROSNE|nr:putative immunoglobulin variable region used by the ITC63b heavy chain [Rosellinia necatrix]